MQALRSRGINFSQKKYRCLTSCVYFSKVLSAIDVDSDGMIKVDQVTKVLELMGNEQDQLTPKQIRHIVDMLSKEEMLEVENNIEILLGKPEKAMKTD